MLTRATEHVNQLKVCLANLRLVWNVLLTHQRQFINGVSDSGLGLQGLLIRLIL